MLCQKNKQQRKKQNAESVYKCQSGKRHVPNCNVSLYKQAVLPHKGLSDYHWIFLNMGNEVSLVNEGTPIENDLNITWKQVSAFSFITLKNKITLTTIN